LYVGYGTSNLLSCPSLSTILSSSHFCSA